MKRTTHIIFFTALLLCFTTGGYAIFTKYRTPDYYEQNARDHFRHNRWTEGKLMLDEGWKDYGDLSVMNELMGKYYYHFKEYDKARFYLVRALRDDATNTQAREIIVNVEEETHNYSSAICYINELLERNPYSRGWWRRKINIYRKMGNNQEADRLLVRLNQIYPNDEVVKKDIVYLHEQRMIKQKRAGDINGQLESLQGLVQAFPTNPDYYLPLCNMLLQTGRNSEAAEVAGRGARLTGSITLMKKRAAILTEQGMYTEAINYLKECMRAHHIPSLQKEIDEIERTAAINAQMNDPYTSMARVYAKQHTEESLNYLLSTSMSRGYYEDALMYIKDAEKRKGETHKLLYMEFVANRRLGNKSQAMALLNKLFKMDPKDEDVRGYLSEMRYDAAKDAMTNDMYEEAIPELEFVEQYAVEPEMRYGAMTRLYNCYFELKQYTKANEALEKLKDKYHYDHYILQKAALCKADGRLEVALNTLFAAYEKETDEKMAQLIAYQYEEYALPYIKDMVQRGMIRNAHKAVKNALLVAPTSNELLHLAITTSDMLGMKDDYADMVRAGKEKYPDDPFFIVKEAGLMDAEGDHAGAVKMLYPQLEVYLGDTVLVKAFSAFSRNLAMDQAKAKAYNSAIATLDTALVYNHSNNELLYTKGLVYEAMHQYDSAYVYQKYYKPTLMDFREHSRHLEELQGQGFKNEVTITYQQARPGSEDIISANAYASYLKKGERNDYTFSMAYAGRDGSSADDLTKDEMESGGTGVMLGLDWHHRFRNNSPWAFTVGASWASKYFPVITLRATIEREMWDTWLINAHASYRSIKAYTKRYKWIENEERTSDADPEYVYVSDGWKQKDAPLTQFGLTAQRTIPQFVIQGGVDGFIMNNKLYFSGQLKGQFFPLEGSRTHVFAMGGIGSAPQTELLDQSMPAGFSKLNTFVGGGLTWFFNKHIAASLSGTWYTMYRSQDIQTGIWGNEEYSVDKSSSTNYKNMYYVQGQIIATF